ncbi:hypothetical protein llap_14569 [Limosa lapponica baueri]|uniref:Ig-like domain-containing protein n=1 Tax=Limosa lapponica baueri TaxID=1758121 RepID=A0A2I0TMU0_LIMLA|nr:hypothetical protein llap_14569 [Limosa lapponica baueri]
MNGQGVDVHLQRLQCLQTAQVHQEPLAETTNGTGISINCSYTNIKTMEFILWYHQLLGQGPASVVVAHKGSKEEAKTMEHMKKRDVLCMRGNIDGH